jgi:alginate O-acetyltransferase complex protein AlgI
LAEKWAADNLTGWIAAFEQQYSTAPIGLRWAFLAALSARILLDFSGYSDMAIGFARMLGVQVPENFNWPYLARSPLTFWRRWHMSLSTWIRDYVYIPLGGDRLGPTRQLGNGLAAMALCGLWHGPNWHFVAWGLYHGAGLAAGRLVERGGRHYLHASGPAVDTTLGLISWAGTMLFVCIGWLLFFYPLDRAAEMAIRLFQP